MTPVLFGLSKDFMPPKSVINQRSTILDSLLPFDKIVSPISNLRIQKQLWHLFRPHPSLWGKDAVVIISAKISVEASPMGNQYKEEGWSSVLSSMKAMHLLAFCRGRRKATEIVDPGVNLYKISRGVFFLPVFYNIVLPARWLAGWTVEHLSQAWTGHCENLPNQGRRHVRCRLGIPLPPRRTIVPLQMP